MIAMTTEMEYQLLLWTILALSLIVCALVVICEILDRRLIATKKILRNYQSSLCPDKIEIIPKTRVTAPPISTIGLSKITGNVSLKGFSPNIVNRKIPNKIAVTIKYIIDFPLFAFIMPVYKRVKHYVNQNRAESLNPFLCSKTKAPARWPSLPCASRYHRQQILPP